MADDDSLLPWLEETYGQDVEEAPVITIWSSDKTNDEPDINIRDVADFSSIPEDFDIIDVDGVTSLSDDALRLFHLLQNDPRIWEEVRFCTRYDQPSSPALLAILIAAMKKTKCLGFFCTLSDKTVYSCLATGLLAQDGIQELKLHRAGSLEEDAAKVLAEALVCSTYLKRLYLFGSNLRDEGVCFVLGEALKRNRSLEALHLGLAIDGSLPELLVTLPNHPNLSSLWLDNQNLSEQVMEVLREWLSCEDCRLQDLAIYRDLYHSPTFSTITGGEEVVGRTLQRLERFQPMTWKDYATHFQT